MAALAPLSIGGAKRILTGLSMGPGALNEPEATAFIDRIESLVAEIKIPTRLNQLGVRREQIPALVAGSHGNSLSGNPRDIGDAELMEILSSIW